MAKIKRPVIYNTTHKYNFNVSDEHKDNVRELVDGQNWEALLTELNLPEDDILSQLGVDNNEYEFREDQGANPTIIPELCKKAKHIYYYTNKQVSEEVLDAFSQFQNGTVVYTLYQAPTKDVYQFISEVTKATEVNLVIPINLVDMEPYNVLFDMVNFRTIVDQVILTFPEIDEEQWGDIDKKYYDYSLDEEHLYLKTENKFNIFKLYQRPFSVWGMGIQLRANTDSEVNTLLYYRLCDQGMIKEGKHTVHLEDIISRTLV